MFYVEKILKENLRGGGAVFEYHLRTGAGITVGVFHNERFACEVRDLLNEYKSDFFVEDS